LIKNLELEKPSFLTFEFINSPNIGYGTKLWVLALPFGPCL
jgi:hypothetical protein